MTRATPQRRTLALFLVAMLCGHELTAIGSRASAGVVVQDIAGFDRHDGSRNRFVQDLTEILTKGAMETALQTMASSGASEINPVAAKALGGVICVACGYMIGNREPKIKVAFKVAIHNHGTVINPSGPADFYMPLTTFTNSWSMVDVVAAGVGCGLTLYGVYHLAAKLGFTKLSSAPAGLKAASAVPGAPSSLVIVGIGIVLTVIVIAGVTYYFAPSSIASKMAQIDHRDNTGVVELIDFKETFRQSPKWQQKRILHLKTKDLIECKKILESQ